MILSLQPPKQDIITNIIVSRYECPLIKPYVLSFVTLNEFISLRICIVLESGQRREAEVVPLLGYSDESETDIVRYIKEKAPVLIGKHLLDARQEIEQDIKCTPFSVTAILTAIDLFFYDDDNTQPYHDFVMPASTNNYKDLEKIANKQNSLSGTIKIKLSGHYEEDCYALGKLNSHNNWSNLKIRLDANQAYSISDADKLFAYLSKLQILENISYVEQPLKSNEWDGNLILRKKYPLIDIMLDESIITKEEIIKARKIDIKYVKLKLFKQGGIRELLNLSNIAFKNGIKTVLGNGVATWLSNKIEISVFFTNPEYYYGALEANGFQKTKDSETKSLLFKF